MQNQVVDDMYRRNKLKGLHRLDINHHLFIFLIFVVIDVVD